MSFTNEVAGGVTSSAQQKSCCTKSEDATGDTFKSLLSDMMQSGNTQISVSRVEVTGTAYSDNTDMLFGDGSLSELSDRLKYLLDRLFIKNGIPVNPPVEVSYSYTETRVMIKGDREDIQKISDLINADDDLVSKIKNVMELAGSIVNMAESMQLQSEYRGSADPDSILDDYAHLFDEDRDSHTAALCYSKSLSFLSDGKEYNL